MKFCFTVEIALIKLQISCNSEKIKEVCKDFIVDEPPLFSVFPDERDIREYFSKGVGSLEYCEMLAIFKQIAETLPLYNAYLLHGAGIKYKERGIIFLASSGVGKTTHVNLWKKYLGDEVEIINGDKPFLKEEEGKIFFYDEPWRGKERCGNRGRAPLTDFCVIKRAKQNKITPLSPRQTLEELLNRLYLPESAEGLEKTLAFLNKLPLFRAYLLECNVDKQAFITAFNAVTGEEYED